MLVDSGCQTDGGTLVVCAEESGLEKGTVLLLTMIYRTKMVMMILHMRSWNDNSRSHLMGEQKDFEVEEGERG